MRYADRREAGQALARALAGYADRPDVVVLGLPRGGVPVAREVADALHVPLDVLVVRKLGVPGHRELACGAIASGGARVVNADVVARAGVAAADLAAVEELERVELARREELYRGGRGFVSVAGAAVLLVDDGLATGASMRVAATAARQLGAARVVCAVPVAPPGVEDALRDVADEVVVVESPPGFGAVGQFYDDFTATTDAQVREALASY